MQGVNQVVCGCMQADCHPRGDCKKIAQTVLKETGSEHKVPLCGSCGVIAIESARFNV